MSLLIEGIYAPITCASCDESIYVGLGFMYLYCKLVCKKEKTDIVSKRRADFCPMKNIKEPHGRLVDADKLLKDHGLKLTEEFAPTVVEAEGSKDDH